MPHVAKIIAPPEACEMTPPWSSLDRAAAQKEGWNIFATFGSKFGNWQVLHINREWVAETTTQPGSDLDAWIIVADGIAPHHIAAKNFIQTHNP